MTDRHQTDPIRDLTVERDPSGQITRVRFVVGPHHFVEARVVGHDPRVALGYTHHGFEASAAELNGDLEHIINEARRTHPELAFD